MFSGIMEVGFVSVRVRAMVIHSLIVTWSRPFLQLLLMMEQTSLSAFQAAVDPGMVTEPRK